MKIRIANGLVFFSFLVTFSLSLIVAFIVSYQTDKALVALEENRIDSETRLVISHIGKFLQNRLNILSDHSRFAIVRQSVMQPEQMFFYLQDFMADITILGRRYKESLVDFEGNIIFSTDDKLQVNYQDVPNIQQLLNGGEFQAITLNQYDSRYYWTLMQPVIYQGYIEGAIVVEIPFSQMLIDLELNDKLSGEILTSLDYPEGRWILGQGILHDRTFVTHWERFGLVFRVGLDETTLTGFRSDIVNNIVLTSMISALVIAILAFFVGDRLFVRPLRYLQAKARYLADGIDQQDVKPVLIWKETKEVATGFDQMANVVQQREHELTESFHQIQSAHNRLRESQAQLVQSEKMAGLGTMAAGVAHEINNPVGFVRSNLETLKGYIKDYERFHNLLAEEGRISEKRLSELAESAGADFAIEDSPVLIDESVEGVNRVTEIVSSLKNFARADTEIVSDVDVNAGIKSTLRLINNELKYHCTVHESYGDLPLISCNAGQINQVVMNLIINASQAIKGEGEIFIRTWWQSGKVYISIRDTGYGIAPDVKDKIFNPFFTTKAPGEGTGLGLSLIHNIVEQHRGRIDVVSVPGEGAEFIVSLPA